jgi:hypothetical protein
MLVDLLPIDHVEEGGDVFRTAVLVLQAIGVRPTFSLVLARSHRQAPFCRDRRPFNGIERRPVFHFSRPNARFTLTTQSLRGNTRMPQDAPLSMGRKDPFICG